MVGFNVFATVNQNRKVKIQLLSSVSCDELQIQVIIFYFLFFLPAVTRSNISSLSPCLHFDFTLSCDTNNTKTEVLMT